MKKNERTIQALEEVAAKLDYVQYGNEDACIDDAELKEKGIVVAYGAGDDIFVLRGAIDDEWSAYGGGEWMWFRGTLVSEDDMQDINASIESCGSRPFSFIDGISLEFAPSEIPDLTWLVSASVPIKASFRIMEDEEAFCIGEVFYLDHLRAIGVD